MPKERKLGNVRRDDGEQHADRSPTNRRSKFLCQCQSVHRPPLWVLCAQLRPCSQCLYCHTLVTLLTCHPFRLVSALAAKNNQDGPEK